MKWINKPTTHLRPFTISSRFPPSQYGLLDINFITHSLTYSILQLFVYLFAPLCHLIKEHDLQSFRLENGIKLWQSLWEYKHPTARCFSALCKPRPLGKTSSKLNRKSFGDIFTGSKIFLLKIKHFTDGYILYYTCNIECKNFCKIPAPICKVRNSRQILKPTMYFSRSVFLN